MKLIKILFLVIIALVIVSVTLTNRTLDEGIVVADLSKDITSIQNQNTIMSAEIASAGSISNLRVKLEEAGYIETSKVVSLSNISSVALR